MRRLSRLHNVNHFIVSQVNPHVAPVSRLTDKRGVVPKVAGVTVESLRVQLVRQLELARGLARDTRFYNTLDRAHSLAEQTYAGDINIILGFEPVRFFGRWPTSLRQSSSSTSWKENARPGRSSPGSETKTCGLPRPRCGNPETQEAELANSVGFGHDPRLALGRGVGWTDGRLSTFAQTVPHTRQP